MDIRMEKTCLAILVLFVVGLLSGCSSSPSPEEHRAEQPWPYYIYLPEAYTPDQAWPLFIGVHGSARDGRSCWNTWQAYADEHGYVLLCPELADSDGRLHQLRGSARLLEIIGRVYELHTLQPRMFLVGFSAGGQFIHGYAFMNPGYVVGVSVIAAGNVYEPPQAGRQIPFVVIVGENDNPGNVENAHRLAQSLMARGYPVDLHVLSGEGHSISTRAIEITLDLFDSTMPGN